MHERIVHRFLGHEQQVSRHELGQIKPLTDHPHIDMLRAAVARLASDRLELGLDMTMHGIDGVETLQRLREGFTNAEIARLLGITTHTVKVHVAALITKLGVSDRTQAVARGFDLGLLTVKTQQA
jgi:DNA-binding CsgD family transcriptional regulator